MENQWGDVCGDVHGDDGVCPSDPSGLDQFQLFRMLIACAARHAWPLYQRALVGFCGDQAIADQSTKLQSKSLCEYFTAHPSLQNLAWSSAPQHAELLSDLLPPRLCFPRVVAKLSEKTTLVQLRSALREELGLWVRPMIRHRTVVEPEVITEQAVTEQLLQQLRKELVQHSINSDAGSILAQFELFLADVQALISRDNSDAELLPHARLEKTRLDQLLNNSRCTTAGSSFCSISLHIILSLCVLMPVLLVSLGPSVCLCSCRALHLSCLQVPSDPLIQASFRWRPSQGTPAAGKATIAGDIETIAACRMVSRGMDVLWHSQSCIVGRVQNNSVGKVCTSHTTTGG